MRRLSLLLILTACGAPLVPPADGGTTDSGTTVPDAGHRACFPSSCLLDGSWDASYTQTSTAPATYCIPSPEPLIFTNDGGTVCIERASGATTDGGCGFSFSVQRSGFDLVGTESWSFDVVDAGVIAGALSVVQQFPACDASYTFRATR